MSKEGSVLVLVLEDVVYKRTFFPHNKVDCRYQCDMERDERCKQNNDVWKLCQYLRKDIEKNDWSHRFKRIN